MPVNAAGKAAQKIRFIHISYLHAAYMRDIINNYKLEQFYEYLSEIPAERK